MHEPGGFYQNLPNGSFVSFKDLAGNYIIKKYTVTNTKPYDVELNILADFSPDSIKKMEGGWYNLMDPYQYVKKRTFAFTVQFLPVEPKSPGGGGGGNRGRVEMR